MTFSIEIQPVPLRVDSDGVIRVKNTRVTLDTIVAAFLDGATAEEIAYQYPSVNLPDIYSVIAYYLQRRTDIEEYLEQRQQQANTVRQKNEDQFAPDGVRDRLLARRTGEER